MYTDAAQFDQDHPDVTLEDFEDSNVVDYAICADPVHAGAEDPACFDRGDIDPGILFVTRNHADDAFVLYGSDVVPANPTKFMAVNWFLEPLILQFPGGDVSAVGLDLFVVGGPWHEDVKVNVFAPDGDLLLCTTAAVSPEGDFWGISFTDACAIGRIEFEVVDDTILFDNVRFHGARFVQDAYPRTVQDLDTIQLWSSNGVEGEVRILAVTGLDGLPVFSVIDVFSYDSTGVRSIQGTIPSTLFTGTLSLTTFSLDEFGTVVVTNAADVTVL